ncbi:response regulator [Limnoglobus roseus]|nr:response regulator [Limnoglobus roseus]
MTLHPPIPEPNGPDNPGATRDHESSIILVVDDSPVDRRVAGRMIEKRGNWRVEYACDGEEALEVIGRLRPAAVVTDLQMPRIDGLELVTRVRAEYPKIPVIIMTGQGSEKIAVAALKAGAASYVTKQTLAADLASAVEQVLAASQTDDCQTKALQSLKAQTTHFEIDNDPTVVSPLIALLQHDIVSLGICDATAVTRVGIALEETLLNAIYHGNLGVSSELKCVNEHAFYAQVTERRQQAPYRDRRVRITARLKPHRATFVVSDGGDGFDISSLPDPTDPSFFDRPSGRGILLMRAFMDEVGYNARGNRVILVKKKESPPDPSEAE